ncbi:DoxX family protein [Lonsdalea quercina]|uniref:DoxX family protein n=1 Tax=Lonsdalea quercina TaxID=71657 RepID=UPI003975EB8C
MLNGFNSLFERPDFGKLVLRVSFGAMMLFHGVHKLIAGIDGIQSMVMAHGLPGIVGYGVYVGEVIAPVLMILGILTRPSALIFTLTMLAAYGLTDLNAALTLDKTGAWGIESMAVYFFAGLAILMLGGGRYSLASNPRWR